MSDTIFYSATQNGFYLSSLKDAYEASKKGWPNDAVEISEEEHSRLLAKQSEGKVLSPNKNGYPVLTDPPQPTHKQAVLVASDKQKTDLGIATKNIAPLQDAIDLDMATDEEKAQLAAWKKYRVLLNRVDISTAPDIDWPEPPTAQATSETVAETAESESTMTRR